MKQYIVLFLSLAAVLLPGCGRQPVLAQAETTKEQTAAAPAAEKAPDYTVDGDRITFQEKAPQLASLSVESCKARTEVVLHFNGRVVWNDEKTVGVFSPVNGRVKEILANLGDKVDKGTPLLTIDSPDFGQAQAELRQADSGLRLSERNLARTRELFDHGAAARKDLESAEADRERAEAEKERATAHLALLGGKNAAVDQIYHLCAPIAGTVVEKNTNPGQELRPDQMSSSVPQFLISDPTNLWVYLDITEKDISAVRPGQTLAVTTSAYPGRSFNGKIDNVGDALDAPTRTVKVRGTLENPDRLLKAQMYVAVDVVDGQQPMAGVSVPSKALYIKGTKHFTFVSESPELFIRREVVVGTEYSDETVVTEGLTPETKVVTTGSLLLQSVLESGEKPQ